MAGALVIALAGVGAVKLMRSQHRDDRRSWLRFHALLGTIHDERAIMFVRYSPMHDSHVALVRNVANLDEEQVWVVYDRGDAENAGSSRRRLTARHTCSTSNKAAPYIMSRGRHR